MKKKICIVTGSRAEYGLFYPLLKEIKKEPFFRLQIVATGTHLSSSYGLTYKEIVEDGFEINKKVKIPVNNDTPEGISKSLATGLAGFASTFKRIKPDFVVLLGDRFETYSAAIAAFLAGIPIIHLQGGELTEGAVDDAFRHSITKFSTLHLTSTEDYRRRVIQLGEDPRRVFNVGALGIDNCRKTKLLSRTELERELNFSLKGRIVLVTFHPVTLENHTSEVQFNEIIDALKHCKNLRIIFTKPNFDIGGRVIIKLIDKFVRNNPLRSATFSSLGRLKYLSLMKYVDVMLGNSSSGIIEMPYFAKPTVNIGDRQKGRIKAKSIIQCLPEEKSILKAIKKSFLPNFRRACLKIKNPYGSGRASEKIVLILKSELLKIKELKKEFYKVTKI